MSKQRQWQLLMKSRGRCVLCGDWRGRYAELCDRCRGEVNEASRRRYRERTPAQLAEAKRRVKARKSRAKAGA